MILIYDPPLYNEYISYHLYHFNLILAFIVFKMGENLGNSWVIKLIVN